MKALVLVSGWGFTRHIWDPLAALLEKDFAVTAYDHRDLKQAAPQERRTALQSRQNSNPEPTALESRPPIGSCYAQGLQILLSRHDRPLVAGWSMGGMVALEAVQSDPDLCSGLGLISSSLRFCRTDDYTFGIPPAALRAMMRGLKQDPDATLASFLQNTEQPQSDLLDVNQRDALLVSDADELLEGLTYLRETDLRTCRLPASLPVAVFHGTRDTVIPMAAGKWMAQQLGDRRLESYPGFGHALPYACPEKVAIGLKKILNEFM